MLDLHLTDKEGANVHHHGTGPSGLGRGGPARRAKSPCWRDAGRPKQATPQPVASQKFLHCVFGQAFEEQNRASGDRSESTNLRAGLFFSLTSTSGSELVINGLRSRLSA